jgi:hypothetical protein
MFETSQNILESIDTLSFDQAKDMIGFSLREDYASSIVSEDPSNLRVGVDDELEQVEAPYIR